MSERYVGTRMQNGDCLVQIHLQLKDGTTRVCALPLRLDLRRHSPTGFEWGYQGSGPAQLALAILANAVEDDDHAQAAYQEFKREVVANLPRDRWVIEKDLVLRWFQSKVARIARSN